MFIGMVISHNFLSLFLRVSSDLHTHIYTRYIHIVDLCIQVANVPYGWLLPAWGLTSECEKVLRLMKLLLCLRGTGGFGCVAFRLDGGEVCGKCTFPSKMPLTSQLG